MNNGNLQKILDQLSKDFTTIREPVRWFIADRLSAAGFDSLPEFFSVRDLFGRVLGYGSPPHAIRRSIPEDLRASVPRVGHASVVPLDVAIKILEYAYNHGRYKSIPTQE